MKLYSITIFCLFFLGCKGQSNVFLDKLDNKLINYISISNRDDKEKKRYIDNEVKYILNSRKQFFLNLDLGQNKQMDLIEILDLEMPSSIYSAYLKINSDVYLFVKTESLGNHFDKMNFDDFRKTYAMISCLFIEMTEDTNKLKYGSFGSSFHFTVFISKINNESINIYEAKDICDLNEQKR
jgi:hypothetical protein